jgi:multiple sugar transport system ATP-binding protein
VLIRLNGKETTCRVHPMHAGRRGEEMDVGFDFTKAVFFDPATGDRIA